MVDYIHRIYKKAFSQQRYNALEMHFAVFSSLILYISLSMCPLLARSVSNKPPLQAHPPRHPKTSPRFHIPNSPISPPPPFPPPAVLCIRSIYCLLTVFHATIYFSMHVVKHFSSLDDNEEPGVGMHLSKQWLFIF